MVSILEAKMPRSHGTGCFAHAKRCATILACRSMHARQREHLAKVFCVQNAHQENMV